MMPQKPTRQRKVRMDNDYEENLTRLLYYLDMTLDDILKIRSEVLKNGLTPKALMIPGCRLLGMDLKFGNVKTVTIVPEALAADDQAMEGKL